MKDPPRSLGAALAGDRTEPLRGSHACGRIGRFGRFGHDFDPVSVLAGTAPIGTVGFAHGSGSGRFSPRNQRIAADVVRAGLATLLTDQLTEAEEVVDRKSEHLRVDLWLLADGSA